MEEVADYRDVRERTLIIGKAVTLCFYKQKAVHKLCKLGQRT